jgi:hypothetical protein
MNITLRKASAIQTSINEVLKSLDFNTTISINEFQDVEGELQKASSKFYTNVTRRIDLLNALYEIRKAVSSANYKASVDTSLADIARLEKDIQFYGQHAINKVRETNAVITGKLDRIRNRKEDSYIRHEEVNTCVFTEDDLNKFKGALAIAKKQKQKLQDDLLEVNVRTEITLSDSAAETLKKENIL